MNGLAASVALAATLVSLGACSASADIQAAEQAVPRFRELLDGARFDPIYADASDDFERATRQAESTRTARNSSATTSIRPR